MGQEAGKPVWPKPAGGYQTTTGRRYGRRHAYVGFRPSLSSQDRDELQHNEDSERLELEDVQKENSLCSSPLVEAQASSGLLDEPFLESVGTGEPICQSVSSQTFEVNASSFSLFSYGLEGNQISGNLMNPYENSEDLAEYESGGHNDLNGQNGIAFVNIDSYEPDSSDGEEDDAQDKFSVAREEAGVYQDTLDNMFSELEKDIESFTDLQSQLSALNRSVSRPCCEEAGPMPLMRYFSIDSAFMCPNNRTFRSSTEDQATLKNNLSGASYETQEIKNTVNVGVGTPVAIANELNVNDGKTDQGNSPELVVRPKIRKQNTAEQLERENLFPNDDEDDGSWRRTELAEVQQGHAECALQNSKEMSSSMFFDSREYKGHPKNTEIDIRKNAAAREQKKVLLDNSTFWYEFEDCSRHFSVSHKDEDSSECSDGEWSTAVPTYFTATEDQSSSGESWETVPGREEHEPEEQSSSSGVEEENAGFSFQGGEQMLLEEGEIPWLQYREEVESSSDEEDDPVSDFVHPELFLLDGNNNLEDDFSVNEDLDVEWRLLEEFDDGLGLVQAIPYVDPQFLTFMALEGRLQEAMEAALAHLESLGFDFEQAYPPATKETIDCLPQIIITDDHNGQEQCCTICCSEYVKDEIITELPCHHLFHKTCITLWLQKSGTCPVCRHVLAPVLPEAEAASVSLLSDPDSASPVHGATGVSN